MKNNTLHIIYNGSLISQKCGMDKDAIKSHKCNKIERAKEIVQNTSSDVLERAVWKDKDGKEYSTEEILAFTPSTTPEPNPSNRQTRKRFLAKNIDTIIEKKKIREKNK